jgi:hypothetical protein
MHNTPSTNRTVSPLFGLHGLIGAAAALTTIALAACDGSSGKPAPVESQVVYSDAFTIDTTWASMQGPYRVMHVQLTDSTSHELVWVVGYEAAIVDADTREPKSSEFMCHSNVDLDMARHRQIFGWQKYPSRRLFTLSRARPTCGCRTALAFRCGRTSHSRSPRRCSIITTVARRFASGSA